MEKQSRSILSSKYSAFLYSTRVSKRAVTRRRECKWLAESVDSRINRVPFFRFHEWERIFAVQPHRLAVSHTTVRTWRGDCRRPSFHSLPFGPVALSVRQHPH